MNRQAPPGHQIRSRRREPTLRSDLCWTPLVLLTDAAAIVGCWSAAISVDYTKNFPLTKAIAFAMQAPAADRWKQVAHSGLPWFIGTSAILWGLLLAFGRHRLARRVILIAALIVPFLLCQANPLTAPFFAIFSPLITLEYLLGPNGETISEGQLTWAAIGWWWLLNACLLIGALRRRSIPAHLCPECRYDMRGLPSPICPECGHTRVVVSVGEPTAPPGP